MACLLGRSSPEKAAPGLTGAFVYPTATLRTCQRCSGSRKSARAQAR